MTSPPRTASFFGLPLWQGWLIGAGIGQVFAVADFTAFAVLAGDPRRSSVATAALRERILEPRCPPREGGV